MHLINFKFMCLSAYLQWKLVSVRDKISGGSYRKIILFFRQPLRREETKLIWKTSLVSEDSFSFSLFKWSLLKATCQKEYM